LPFSNKGQLGSQPNLPCSPYHAALLSAYLLPSSLHQTRLVRQQIYLKVTLISMVFIISCSGIAFMTFKLLCIKSVKAELPKFLIFLTVKTSQNKHELILSMKKGLSERVGHLRSERTEDEVGVVGRVRSVGSAPDCP
jgi:hypothetical protein